MILFEPFFFLRGSWRRICFRGENPNMGSVTLDVYTGIQHVQLIPVVIFLLQAISRSPYSLVIH